MSDLKKKKKKYISGTFVKIYPFKLLVFARIWRLFCLFIWKGSRQSEMCVSNRQYTSVSWTWRFRCSGKRWWFCCHNSLYESHFKLRAKKKTRYILCVANVSYHLTWKQSLTSVLCVQICLLTFIIIKRSAQKNFTFCPDWSKFELWHIVKRGLKVLLWQRSDLWEKWDFQNELASLRITLDSFLLKNCFFFNYIFKKISSEC